MITSSVQERRDLAAYRAQLTIMGGGAFR